MVIIWVASISENAGKTMLCAGLGKRWLEQGHKPGYLKPIFSNNKPDDGQQDAAFMQKTLGLPGPADLLCPVIDPSQQSGELLKEAIQESSADRDILFIESPISRIPVDLPTTLNARILIVHDYVNPLSNSLSEYSKFSDRLMGLVINKVPQKDLKKAASQIASILNATGIKLLGLIPEDRILSAPEIADLITAVQGKTVNNTGSPSDLIENLMLGSSTFDRGAAYYSRKNNKAVILWGERPGFRKAALANYQLAALQTSTHCIIISANGMPIPNVTQKADEAKATIISAPGTILEIVSAIEKHMETLKFHQEKKLPHLLEILQSNIELTSIKL